MADIPEPSKEDMAVDLEGWYERKWRDMRDSVWQEKMDMLIRRLHHAERERDEARTECEEVKREAEEFGKRATSRIGELLRERDALEAECEGLRGQVQELRDVLLYGIADGEEDDTSTLFGRWRVHAREVLVPTAEAQELGKETSE